MAPSTCCKLYKVWLMGACYHQHNKALIFPPQIIKGSGHHVYADKADDFNHMVCTVGAIVDEQIDLLGRTPVAAYRRLRHLSESGTSRGGGAGMRRRIASECTISDVLHKEEVHPAALGTSYSTSIIEDPEEVERPEEKGEELEELGERVESTAKFSLGGDSEEEEEGQDNRGNGVTDGQSL